MSASQESLYDDMSEFDSNPFEETFRGTGLGKGKPYASKIAKKKLSYSTGMPGRPKGSFGKGKRVFFDFRFNVYHLRIFKQKILSRINTHIICANLIEDKIEVSYLLLRNQSFFPSLYGYSVLPKPKTCTF